VCRFQKDFYTEHAEVSALPAAEIDEFRRVHEMTVSQGCPRPVRTFREAHFPDYILAEIEKAGMFTVVVLNMCD